MLGQVWAPGGVGVPAGGSTALTLSSEEAGRQCRMLLAQWGWACMLLWPGDCTRHPPPIKRHNPLAPSLPPHFPPASTHSQVAVWSLLNLMHPVARPIAAHNKEWEAERGASEADTACPKCARL